MISAGQLLGFTVTCLIVIAVPGPSVLFVVGRALAHGRRAASEGFLVGITNPKAYILFAAVLPQFANQAAGHVPVQLLLLSLVSLPIGLICDSAWGLAASGVRAWFARSPQRLALVGGLGGLAMIGLGLTLAFTGHRD
jgi:threonine/homoserine/homoserine lactone efflux protein